MLRQDGTFIRAVMTVSPVFSWFAVEVVVVKDSALKVSLSEFLKCTVGVDVVSKSNYDWATFLDARSGCDP